MSRIALQPIISPRLFRHFAVITVGITIVIGIMADGESREAVVDEYTQIEQQNERKRIEAAKLGPQEIHLKYDKDKYRPKGFDGENRGDNVNFGTPMDGGGGGGGGADMGGYASSDSGGSGFRGPPEGYDTGPSQSDPQPSSFSGTDGQAGGPFAPKPKAPPKPTPEQIAQTLAASRARSGGDSSDDAF